MGSLQRHSLLQGSYNCNCSFLFSSKIALLVLASSLVEYGEGMKSSDMFSMYHSLPFTIEIDFFYELCPHPRDTYSCLTDCYFYVMKDKVKEVIKISAVHPQNLEFTEFVSGILKHSHKGFDFPYFQNWELWSLRWILCDLNKQ